MLQTPKLEIRSLIKLALRRKWWFIIPFIISVLGGLVYLKVCPKSYLATTLILLEPQSIPDSFVRSTVIESMEGRLNTISQQIQSRTNLEKVIQDFGLDRDSSGGRQSDLKKVLDKFYQYIPSFGDVDSSQGQAVNGERIKLTNLVDQVRRGLTVTMRSGSHRGGGGREQNLAFEISFEWGDPEVVAQVTNSITSRFIEENLNAREEMAIGTTDFLEKETAMIRSELEKRDKDLEAFKTQNMGMLPDQLEANIHILNQLREQLLSLERRLDQEKQQALILNSQAEFTRMERDAIRLPNTMERSRTGGSRREQPTAMDLFASGSLEDLERELSRLTILYKDRHPDIIVLKHRIETLKKEGKTASGRTGEGAQGSSQGRIGLQLGTINANIESYKREIQETEKQIEMYKQRVERTPQVEMELNKIRLDYQTVRQRYDNLLTKKLDAKLAEQMEKRKKGEQFRVLDPATKPAKPFKPDMWKIMIMALAAGLGLGGGLAYLREMLDPHFYSPDEVEAFLEVPVILSLPMADAETRS